MRQPVKLAKNTSYVTILGRLRNVPRRRYSRRPLPLLRRYQAGAFSSLRRFDLCRLFLDQFDEVVDDVGVFEAVVGEAADVDLVGVVAAAGEADVGFAGFARAVDDTADDRHGQGRRDVREALLEPLDRFDDLELLAGAG